MGVSYGKFHGDSSTRTNKTGARGAAGNGSSRSGGKGSEFSGARNTEMSRGAARSTRDGDPGQALGASRTRSAPFNGSNVYGILSRGSKSPTSTGGSPLAGGGAGRAKTGNARFGTGKTSPAGLQFPGKGNPNSRGGSNSGTGSPGRGRRG